MFGHYLKRAEDDKPISYKGNFIVSEEKFTLDILDCVVNGEHTYELQFTPKPI
jgi:hypothetical protein